MKTSMCKSERKDPEKLSLSKSLIIATSIFLGFGAVAKADGFSGRYLHYDQKNIIKGLGEAAKNKEKYTDAFENQTINFCEAMAKGSTLSQGSGIICNQNNQALKVTIIDTNQNKVISEIESGSWKLFDDILAAQIQTGKQTETVQFDPTSPVSKIVAKDGHWGFKALSLK